MDCGTILVLVDGLEPAESAVDAAAALACTHRAAVAVARVRSHDVAHDALVESAVDRLRSAGVPAEGAVLVAPSGQRAAAVAKHAASIGADLVVVGSRGLAGASAVLLGSFSQRVAAAVDLPIVVVRARQGRPDFSRWLVGTTGRQEARRVLATIAALSPGARVHIAVVAAGGVRKPVDVARDAVATARDAGLLASAQVVSGPDVASALLRIAEEHGCGVIILGSRRPRALHALLFGSVGQEIVHEGTVPVVMARR
jgi:nucleotide-binding universal stress UspA family protein